MQFEIALTDLHFHAYHGVLEQETKIGNEFIVNLSVRIPYSEEILTDSLYATISYADIYAIVEEEMHKTRKLLETIAANIHARLIQKWPQITSGSIKITKSKPPIPHISGSSEINLLF